jgi:hypothetical protein
MRSTHRVALAAALLTSIVGATAATGTASASPSKGFTFAVIGDIPYGAAQIANFPKVIAQINADPDVSLVTHLGDIKSGSSQCTDAYFASIKASFDTFADPLVYTPGDNEWTDCHRPNNGSYNPLERLAAVRKLFFPKADVSLGQRKMQVESQAEAGFIENVRFSRQDVEFAMVHIVGSNNSLVNWTGQTAPTVEQLAEEQARTANDIKLIKQTFAEARGEHAKAVVLITQADMFDPTVPNPAIGDWYGFTDLVKTIASESAAFSGPVYLFNGDSHVYTVDHPLATGSSWLSFYGVTTPTSNLTRITIDGSTGVNDWLKVTIDERNPNALSWTKVPFQP